MTLLCLLISLLLTCILPIWLMFYLTFKKKEYRKVFWVGFATFLIFQIFIRIPLLNVLSNNLNFVLFTQNNLRLYSLFLGVTAALFEEVGRFIMMKIALKNQHTTKDAILFGIGHWSCEALLLVGISYVLQALLYGLEGLNPLVILGGLERLFVLPVHVAASIMVMHFVREKQVQYLFMAIIIHTIIDASLIPLQLLFANNIIILEGYIFIVGLLTLYYIYSYINKKGLS